jgi:hypothetical protein
MTGDALFPDDGLRVEAPERLAQEELTAGQRLRARQAARITRGHHPLSTAYGVPLRLHPDAPRDARKDDDRDYPRCGSCTYREVVGGAHERRFPKCLFGYDGSRWWTAFRASNSETSDVRAWWPACVDYARAEAS